MTEPGQTPRDQGSEPVAVAAKLDGHAVAPECLLCAPRGVHGLAHGARVLVWANAIGNSMTRAGDRVDLEVVRWAAVLHDVKRLHDGVDTKHGARAATWVRQAGHPGLCSLSSKQREAVAYCCEWHVPADVEAPVMTPELRCLKDADSLDRVRFGTLDLGFLRTTYALALVPFAHALFAATGRSAPTAGWTEVRAAARDLGFWSDDARVSDPAEGSRNGRCRAC